MFTLTELGNRLRLAREENNLTLEELQKKTKIQKKYLKGIEEGNYEIMPGKFYARAFIKQYTEAVGLDPAKIFEEYKSEIPLAYEEDLPEQLSRIQTRRSGAARSKIWDLVPKILTAIFIVAALFVVWYVITNYVIDKEPPEVENNAPIIQESDEITVPGDETNEADETEPGTKDEEDVAEEEPPMDDIEPEQEITLVNASGSVSTYALSNSDQFHLEVKATENGTTWVRVRNADNHVFFQGELKNGESQSFDFTEETEVEIRAGSSPHTEIFINEEQLEWEQSDSVVRDFFIQFHLQTENE